VFASDKGKKKKRAEALLKLGELYKKVAKSAAKTSGSQFDAFKSTERKDKDKEGGASGAASPASPRTKDGKSAKQ